jgi:carboxyl-terminal processing protease
MRIDDEPTTDLTLDTAVQKIRGPKGTTVKLQVVREQADEPLEFEITRDSIAVKSVKSKMLEGQIAYIEMSQFGNDTVQEFDRAIRDLTAQQARGLILDLRNNPGGLLDDAIKIGGEFVEQKVIVKEKEADGSVVDLRSEGAARLKDLPTVVLVNEGSASASEILAGALRDHRQIPLVGQKTFGKGSVQDLLPLPQETSLRITVAKWLTPNGNEIDEKGIEPDYSIELTDDDYNNDRDPQLDKAKEIMATLTP